MYSGLEDGCVTIEGYHEFIGVFSGLDQAGQMAAVKKIKTPIREGDGAAGGVDGLPPLVQLIAAQHFSASVFLHQPRSFSFRAATNWADVTVAVPSSRTASPAA